MRSALLSGVFEVRSALVSDGDGGDNGSSLAPLRASNGTLVIGKENVGLFAELARS